jgi:hypothetical protein
MYLEIKRSRDQEIWSSRRVGYDGCQYSAVEELDINLLAENTSRLRRLSIIAVSTTKFPL